MPTPDLVRTAAGKMVPAQRSFASKPPAKKFLLVLQYWAGDQEHTEELAELICDLERVRNRDVDVLIFARHDAPAFSQTARDRLNQKFGKVMFERCRRRDATGHPFGGNAMFYDMVCLFSQSANYTTDYFAFVNLESDVCPLHPGWISELIRAFHDAESIGKSCTGFIHSNPVEHMNGVGVYAIDIWKRVGTHKLSGGNPRIAYDIHQAKNILPHATPTPYIVFDYQRPTITADELFSPFDAVEPALFHGVKDNSAREAVRAAHVTMTDRADGSKKTVFTFVNPTGIVNREEEARKLNLWRDGWRSRGWNPVALAFRDALRNTNFQRLKGAADKLPMFGDREAGTNRFIRWLALETMGGGLMVDLDVLPAQFTPADITRGTAYVLTAPESRNISAAYLDRSAISGFVEQLIAYDAQPQDTTNAGIPDVTDFTVWKRGADPKIVPTVIGYGTPGFEKARLVQFDAREMLKRGAGQNPVMAMETFLKGG